MQQLRFLSDGYENGKLYFVNVPERFKPSDYDDIFEECGLKSNKMIYVPLRNEHGVIDQYWRIKEGGIIAKSLDHLKSNPCNFDDTDILEDDKNIVKIKRDIFGKYTVTVCKKNTLNSTLAFIQKVLKTLKNLFNLKNLKLKL